MASSNIDSKSPYCARSCQAVQVLSSEKSFTVIAKSSAEKLGWLADLRLLTSKVVDTLDVSLPFDSIHRGLI